LVSGRIQAFPDCRPLAGALVEVWHADRRGRYSRVGDTRFDDADCLLRANVRTDENGRYTFRTLDPGEYTGRPRHIHFRISAPGFRTLVTQLYFDAQDGVGPLLVARPAQTGQGAARAYEFDVAIGPS
jgi:protocatechuate 3,4-dioxygenase beta subunit